MPSIGGTTCTFIHTAGGRPPAVLREETEVFRLPGINGYGAQKLGLGGGGFQLTAVLYTTAAGARLWEAALQAKQAAIVTIVDDLGTSHTNCLLMHVGNARIHPARNPSGTITQRAELDIVGVKTA